MGSNSVKASLASMAGPPLLTERQAAEILRLSPETLHAWRCKSRRKGPAYYKIGNYIFYKQSDVFEYLESCRHENGAGAPTCSA